MNSNLFLKQKSIIPIIIGINIGVFLLQNLLGNSFSGQLVLYTKDVLVRPWILFTAIFMHGGVSHILFNMYALFIFGPLIEQRIGQKRFLGIYLISGIIASLGFTIYHEIILRKSSVAVGASGAIMAILGLVIILMPQLRVLFFFVIPMSIRTAGILFVLMDVFGLFYSDGIANTAHLAGLGCGLLYGLYLKNKRKEFHGRFRSKTHLNPDDIQDYLRSGRI